MTGFSPVTLGYAILVMTLPSPYNSDDDVTHTTPLLYESNSTDEFDGHNDDGKKSWRLAARNPPATPTPTPMIEHPIQQVRFQEIGQLVPNTQYAHIAFSFRLDEMVDNYNRLVTIFDNFTQLTRLQTRHGERVLKLMAQDFESSEKRFSIAIDVMQSNVRVQRSHYSYVEAQSIGKQPQAERKPRSIFSWIASIASIGLGIFNTAELLSLKSQINGETKDLKRVAYALQAESTVLRAQQAHLDLVQKRLELLTNATRIDAFMDDLVITRSVFGHALDGFNRWIDGLLSVMLHKKFPLYFFEPKQLERALEKIQDTAGQRKLLLPETGLKDLIHGDLSFHSDGLAKAYFMCSFEVDAQSLAQRDGAQVGAGE